MVSVGSGKVMLRMMCMECGGVEVEADSWQSMLVKMMPHYFEHHRDIISGHAEREAGEWMRRFMAEYAAIETREADGS